MFAVQAKVPLRGLAHAAQAVAVLGAAGMAISFVFLASAHPLDVVAGAAGFVAGAMMLAAGLVSLSLLSSRACDQAAPAPFDPARWLQHFRRNQQQRVEPQWQAAISLAPAVVQPLVRSLEQFQLGDGGGPAYLIAFDRERFLREPGMRQLVNLWFAEEREHARLLDCAVQRFGGRCITGHWSFSVFCTVRRWLGVRFELTVLLLTEIVSTTYYRLLKRHVRDDAVRGMCQLILRDEAGHIEFHRARLAHRALIGDARFGRLWELCFRMLGLAAATMLWINHAPGLIASGATTREFYREVTREMTRFIRKLRRG
jgi:hypothetical protein